ncbi:MAG: type VI secretion system amidase immunity protein Tai4 [Betaproteobacteria bacterium]|nr:type VI secretion system amidase immunity protein Tai4 [Betaproteobacteria bacterium]
MAVTRNNATNFKDRALAYCVSQAYKDSPAGLDAQKTGAIYIEMTSYDLDVDSKMFDLIDKYLRRDYSLPIEGYVDAEFALLKCIDMYHSRELDDLVRKYVLHPNWIMDKPAKKQPR